MLLVPVFFSYVTFFRCTKVILCSFYEALLKCLSLVFGFLSSCRAGNKIVIARSFSYELLGYIYEFQRALRPNKRLYYLVYVWLYFERKGTKARVALKSMPFCRTPGHCQKYQVHGLLGFYFQPCSCHGGNRKYTCKFLICSPFLFSGAINIHVAFCSKMEIG